MTTEAVLRTATKEARQKDATRYLKKMSDFVMARFRAEKRLEQKRRLAAEWVKGGMNAQARIDTAVVVSALNVRLADEAEKAYAKAWAGIVENAKVRYGAEAVKHAFDELELSESEKFLFGAGHTLAHGIQVRVVAT